MPNLRLHGVAVESIVDGPGLRFAVFTQGCVHNCPGCHNPHTHDLAGGYVTTIDDLFLQFKKNPLLAGITFSGGEPFLQASPLATLAKQIHALEKTVIIYTGYTIEQLHQLALKDNAIELLMQQADLIIDGPYIAGLRDLESGLKGSTNQRVLDRPKIYEIREALRNP